MLQIAWRNLATRPVRTALALVGLSIPIVGTLGLFSISGGLRSLVGDTLSKVEGMVVIRESSMHPAFSQLPTTLAARLWKTPGVREVAPEVWGISPPIEGGRHHLGKLISSRGLSLLTRPMIQGQDIAAHSGLKSAVYLRAWREKGEGRYLSSSDVGKPNIVISRKIASDYASGDGSPRKPGDTLTIGGKPFTIVGLYDTGSMILDGVIVMDITTARDLLRVAPGTVSSFYVEAADSGANKVVARAIEKLDNGLEAQCMGEFLADFGEMMGQVDSFLFMAISLALSVGVVGVINTMLMSISERTIEFGVLRANGWSRFDLLKLVTLESACMGLLSGMIGCILALVGVVVANPFLSGGVRLWLSPWLFAIGLGLAVVTGTLGGVFPAWRAARLVPMDAIRLGSR